MTYTATGLVPCGAAKATAPATPPGLLVLTSPAPCRKVTKTPSQLLKMGLGMDKWWPSKKPSQALEGEAPAPTAAAGAEAAPQPDAREEGRGKPAAGGHVVEMSADSRGAPGLPAADGSTPVAWTAHSSGETLPASGGVRQPMRH